MNRAVLLLAYGGPDTLDDIPAYLLDIRGGRPTPQHLVDEITERYRLIGGCSPLLRITSSAATKLSARIGLPVYVGMRHWRPFIPDVVAQMAADGVDEMVAICMAPHYSSLSIGAYRAKLDAAVAAAGRPTAMRFVKSWHTEPAYLAGVAANVLATLDRFEPELRDQVKVVFTAHSLPQSILERGDPYDAQLRETAARLAGRLDLSAVRWQFCYQSAAQTGVPWLGPQIEQVVAELGQAGQRNVLVAPIGFIADHVEVLYDIDIGVQAIARANGVHVERPPMLNDSPALVEALAHLVAAQIQG